jgi:hypothetical protein
MTFKQSVRLNSGHKLQRRGEKETKSVELCKSRRYIRALQNHPLYNLRHTRQCYALHWEPDGRHPNIERTMVTLLWLCCSVVKLVLRANPCCEGSGPIMPNCKIRVSVQCSVVGADQVQSKVCSVAQGVSSYRKKKDLR